jgi:glyoxylase-like metal-dependent hydrolase (beta-lactamase superfamily II)
MSTFTKLGPDIFQWSDTCNVYVLRDGDAALLIDLGDGSVLDALGDIGVRRVEWVLFTHHHREQCQGAGKLRGLDVKVAVGAAERALFEQPLSFRKMRPSLSDAHTVHGASYVRPSIEPIAVERVFAKMDDFAWHGRELVCVQTGGHSPGQMAYLLRVDGKWLAFTGDLMLDGAKMHTWFDSEFDYGFARGLYELGNNAAQIAGYAPALLLPSHGPVVRDAPAQLSQYVAKLRRLGELYVRGYESMRFANCDQDPVSRPTAVPHLWQVTPHLYKFRGPDYWVNFHMLLADNGHALLVDCGLFDRAFLDLTITRAKERLGLKQIDAIFVTHMHGDHALDAGHVREKWGAKLWAMEGVADKFEQAWDYDFCALLPAYDPRNRPDVLVPLKFDRIVRNGETIHWEGYDLACDWMPGQTKFHSCLHGVIDGKRVAFTGDNIFASSTDPVQGGNEAVVARNGGALEEGYLYAAHYLHGIAPDLLLGGHCWAIAEPRDLIERLRVRMEALRAAFQSLSVEDDYRYMFDPYVVQALPYRVVVKPGGVSGFTVIVRNYRNREQTHRIAIHTPPGLVAEPAVIEGRRVGEGITKHDVKLRAEPSAKSGLHLVTLDITRDNVRHGELSDLIAWVGDPPDDLARMRAAEAQKPAAKPGY